MTTDPQQEVYISMRQAIAEALIALGYTVNSNSEDNRLFDTVLPPDGTPYPFVYLGFNQQVDEENKSAIHGTIYQTVDVWHSNPKQRGTVSAMMLAIKTACRKIRRTANFSVYVKVDSQTITADDSTGIILARGTLDFKISFS